MPLFRELQEYLSELADAWNAGPNCKIRRLLKRLTEYLSADSSSCNDPVWLTGIGGGHTTDGRFLFFSASCALEQISGSDWRILDDAGASVGVYLETRRQFLSLCTALRIPIVCDSSAG